MNEQAGRHDDREHLPLPQRIAALGRMTATELRREYAAAFGEESRSSNRQWLFRRIAWQLQLVAEGGFARQAVDRSRALARELARESDLRIRPPGAPRPMEADEPATSVPAPVRR